VEIHDPLTYPQLIAYYDAIDEVQSLRSENGDKPPSVIRLRHILLPSIVGCVAKWNLENFPKKVTADTFPASPTIASGEVIDWLQSEVMLLITEAGEVPNES